MPYTALLTRIDRLRREIPSCGGRARRRHPLRIPDTTAVSPTVLDHLGYGLSRLVTITPSEQCCTPSDRYCNAQYLLEIRIFSGDMGLLVFLGATERLTQTENLREIWPLRLHQVLLRTERDYFLSCVKFDDAYY